MEFICNICKNKVKPEDEKIIYKGCLIHLQCHPLSKVAREKRINDAIFGM